MEIMVDMRTVKDLRDESYVEDYADWFFEYDSGYICDVISEIADTRTDCYTDNLWNWARDNQEWVDEAVETFGVDSRNFDIDRLFQQAQCLYYECEMNSNLPNLIEFYAYNYIYRVLDEHEIDEEQYEELEDYLSSLDGNDMIEHIIDKINELFGGE